MRKRFCILLYSTLHGKNQPQVSAAKQIVLFYRLTVSIFMYFLAFSPHFRFPDDKENGEIIPIKAKRQSLNIERRNRTVVFYCLKVSVTTSPECKDPLLHASKTKSVFVARDTFLFVRNVIAFSQGPCHIFRARPPRVKPRTHPTARASSSWLRPLPLATEATWRRPAPRSILRRYRRR